MGRIRRFLRRVVTLGGTPRGIAGGFTLGVALSLIPIPFAGMLIALGIAPLLRMNVPATYLGTAVVNPLTGAAFYFAELWLGMTIMGQDPPAWSELRGLDVEAWWSMFLDLLLPFAVGAALMIAASVVICYPAIKHAAVVFQRRRAKKRKAGGSVGAPRHQEAEDAEEHEEGAAGPG